MGKENPPGGSKSLQSSLSAVVGLGGVAVASGSCSAASAGADLAGVAVCASSPDVPGAHAETGCHFQSDGWVFATAHAR